MHRVGSLVILAIFILFFMGVSVAHAQTPSIFFTVPVKQINEGNTITVDIRVQSSAQSINAVSGAVSFPPSLLKAVSISKEKSIINLWTRDPKVTNDKILFEGVVLNPGFQGSDGLIFRVTFEARQAGIAPLNIIEGAILANDGKGTNILSKFGSTKIRIISPILPPYEPQLGEGPLPGVKALALPIITEYSSSVEPGSIVYLKGKGEPNALTKIVFKDVSFKSIGEQFIEFLQTEKKKLTEIVIQNDEFGAFQYTTADNLLAGVYNATPFLVDTNSNTEKQGVGVQFLINDSKIVKFLILLINILALLIPIVTLIVIIYFIPWYSWRKMRVLKKKLGLEEEKFVISGNQLERQDKMMDKAMNASVDPKTPTDVLKQ